MIQALISNTNFIAIAMNFVGTLILVGCIGYIVGKAFKCDHIKECECAD